MNLSELAQYIIDEKKAEQVLREIGILKTVYHMSILRGESYRESPEIHVQVLPW
jgi:hypothetical protein